MKDRASIIFTGDIGFDRYMEGKWKDERLLSRGIVDFFKTSDHVVANVEGALISAPDDGSRGVYFHCMDPRAVCVLQTIRADVWNIANNHIMDAGKEGMASTLGIAAKEGVLTLGAGIDIFQASRPVFFEEAGGIGLVSVAYSPECPRATETSPGVLVWDDMELIAKRIAEIKATVRWCVVVAHGGEEFSVLPNPYIRDRYIKYLEYGADVVVAHHPHVPQNYETFDSGKAIFYSLGNFIFDTDYQRAHKHTDTGILLRLTFTKDGYSFDALGTKTIRGEERIESCRVPEIFTDVREQEYELLLPLAGKVFLEEEKRRMLFLEPEKYGNATEADWERYFLSDEPENHTPGVLMDLGMVLSYARKEPEKAYEQCKNEKVKKYLLETL